MTDLFGWTNEDLAKEADRELEMRRKLYPKWVADGRMSQDIATRRINLMAAIADRLRADK